MKFVPLAVSLAFATVAAQFANAQEVHMQTTLGEIDIQLDAQRAPKTVANFLRYVREGHFNGTMIYRVVPGFVLQMGSYEPNGSARATHVFRSSRATPAQRARHAFDGHAGDDPTSATAEFFINLSTMAISIRSPAKRRTPAAMPCSARSWKA
ncbi:MAG: peptidylprolyl isomerase [Rhizomicrobium sp.]